MVRLLFLFSSAAYWLKCKLLQWEAFGASMHNYKSPFIGSEVWCAWLDVCKMLSDSSAQISMLSVRYH